MAETVWIPAFAGMTGDEVGDDGEDDGNDDALVEAADSRARMSALARGANHAMSARR